MPNNPLMRCMVSLLIATLPLLSLKAQQAPAMLTFDALEPMLRSNSDTVYVVNFWATWCKPCVEELPYFEKLKSEYRGEKVRILLVSLDFKNQVNDRVLPFIQKRQLQNEVVVLVERNPNKWIDKVDPKWSGAIPATLFSKAGQHRFVEKEFENFSELDDIVKNLLNN